MLKELRFLLTLGLGWTLLGCAPDCASTCEKAQEDGACFVNEKSLGDRVDVNCETYCENLESVMNSKECEEHLEEMLACMDDAENACHALRDSCESEYEKVFGCTGYCEDSEGEDRADCRFVYPVYMAEI